MNEIITAITPAIEKLAEIFNCSVEFIQLHAMEYILMYGKYTCIINIIPFILIFGVLLGLIIGLATFFNVSDTHSTRRSILSAILVFLVIFIIASIVAFCIWGIPYLMAPEMFSIHQVLKLIN